VVGVVLELALIASAAALAMYPPKAVWVERIYSSWLYPMVQSFLTPLSNRVPFAVCDVLGILAAIVLVLGWAIRMRPGGGPKLRTAAKTLLDTAAGTTLLYLAFMGLWGLNYRRVPLVSKLDFNDSAAGEAGREHLVRATIERLNEDGAVCHKAPWPGQDALRSSLRTSFEDVLRDLGARAPVPATPKVSLSDPFLGAAGISGFTNPYGLEVILNTALLPVERPFTLAHEWAHAAGFADESEANFIALLACARSADPAVRYSGWLALYPYIAGRGEDAAGAPAGGAGGPRPHLSPEVETDLRAIAARVRRRLRPSVGRVEHAVYDRYLKANAVKSGIASYGLFVDLLLGTRFEPEWVPALRPSR
jgi:hypothetical protein